MFHFSCSPSASHIWPQAVKSLEEALEVEKIFAMQLHVNYISYVTFYIV